MNKIIGVFATDIASRVQSQLYHTLHESLKTKGYTLVFFSAELNRTDFNSTDESAFHLLELAEGMNFSALLIHVESLQNRDLIQQIIDMGKRKDIPVFLYDCQNYGYSKDDGIITINPDYKQGFASTVDHLIEHHGCKNIYMLAGTPGNPYSEERTQAYREELEAHGLEFSEDKVYYGGFWEMPAIKAVNELFDRIEQNNLPIPDAICSANDSMALSAIRIIKQRGYRVPEDILITGFDGIDDGRFHSPAISTCEPIVDTVADIILFAIETDIRSEEYFIPLRFIPKESCACENSFKADDDLEMGRIIESVRQAGWQHSMLSNLQLSLIDSCNMEELYWGMLGTVNNFKGIGVIYCLRDDLEQQTDFSKDFERLKIILNFDFFEQKDIESFTVKDIVSDYHKLVPDSSKKEFFVIQMLNSNKDRFGYSIIKSENYISDEIRIYSQFGESFTNLLEGILRNIRLDQATKKLNEMYEKVSEMSVHDVMTGLYNRTGYYQELNSYLEQDEYKDEYIHVFSVDMDGLKYINDNFGHQEGDTAIRAAANTIKDCFAQPCVCARFGGDEFMVSLFAKNDVKPTESQISERLNRYIKIYPSVKDKPYPVGLSVGHACIKVSELEDISKLENLADENMYINKRERKSKKN